MAEPGPPPDFFSRHARALAALALILGLVSLFLPYLGIPAFLVAAVVFIALHGRLRWTAGLLALLTSLGGFTIFIVRDAAKAIILAGQRSGEEKAISRLREILWAEDQAKKLGLVKDAAGDGQYLFLGELLGRDRSRRGNDDMPLLKEDLYPAVTEESAKIGVFRAESYLFVVYLPGPNGTLSHEGEPVDPAQSGKHFVAYAWPLGEKVSGSRVFFLDETEHICEADVPSGQGGLTRIPPPWKAFTEPTLGAPVCMRGTDGTNWRPWRHKKPRPDESTGR